MTTQQILQGVHDWTNGKIVYDISVAHPDGQGNPTKYATLAAALGTNGANIPDTIRKGGMSIKFIQSSDNKYVQYRLMSDTFNTTVTNWQGVDDVPTAGSRNLTESGGVYREFIEVKENIKDFVLKVSHPINGVELIPLGFGCKANDEFEFTLSTDTSTTKALLQIKLNGIWTNSGNLVNNTLLKKIFTEDVEEFGVYFGSLSVIQNGTITIKKTDCITDTINNVNNSVNNRIDAIGTDGKNIFFAQLNTTFINGSYYDRNGELTPNSDSKYTEPIDISGYVSNKYNGLRFVYSGNSSGSSRYTLITDENGVILHKISEVGISNNPMIELPLNAKYLKVSCKKVSNIAIVPYIQVLTTKTIFLDADNGSDDNDGSSWASAVKTLSKALELSGEDATIYFTGELKNETFTSINKSKITIIGKSSAKNRIIGGLCLDNTNTEIYQEGVYKAHLDSFPLASYSESYIFQYGVDDVNTLINDNDRHPLQKGKTYRCDCSAIKKATTLEAVLTGDILQYFWDDANNDLYFNIVNGTDLSVNPVYIPNGTLLTFANNKQITITNISLYFCSLYLWNTYNSNVSDCFVGYDRVAGGFRWDSSINVTFKNCEVCRIFTGDGNGDGFNAHRRTSGSAASIKHTTVNLIDCWAHDVSDDGYSDHEGCESHVIGGLYEFCEKGCLTPAYGSHCTAIGVMARYSFNGFFCTGESLDGDNGTQMICYECISYGHTHPNPAITHGAGYKVDNNNTLIAVNCKSLNNKFGYFTKDTSKMILYDCGSSENVLTTKISNDSQIITKNTEIVNIVPNA